MNVIDARHHQDLWKLVNCLGRMRFHLTCIAYGPRQSVDVGVYRRAKVQELHMEITLYGFRYHQDVQLPPVPIEQDPRYVATLQACIVGAMNRQEADLFEQMCALVSLMQNEIQLRQPKRGDDATSIITWLYCQKLDELLTYMDIGVLKKVRATGRLQLRCLAESDTGRLLQARLSQDGPAGELFLWDKPAGTWQYTGMSIGALLISLEDLPDSITQLSYWSELRPHVLPESSAHARKEQYT